MVDLQIKFATHDHVEDIWKIIRSSFDGPQSQYVAIGQPGYSLYLHDLLNNSNTGPKLMVLAMVHGQVAGFADITINRDSPNFLTRIAVKSDFRGYGVAGLTMSEIQRTYGTRNEWELDVFQENTGARRLYESFGFAVTSTNKWLGRMLPLRAGVDDGMIQSHAEDPTYSRYGFTNIDIQGHNISIAGAAVRCREIDLFLDDSFLAKVQQKFPKVNRTFIVFDEADDRLSSRADVFEIGRSDRMAGSF